jgi:hypothetical protein
MGGFAIDTHPRSPDESKFIYRYGSPRLTVTDAGTLFLAQHGCLPDISTETITDKRKADDISKGLVCVQAGWLVVQCIARLAAGLPVTLLEVVTLAHCLSALAMYALWWHKPLEISVPVCLDHPYIRQMAAFMVIDGQTSTHKYSHDDILSAVTPNSSLTQPSIHVCRRMANEASEIFTLTTRAGNDTDREPLVSLRARNWARNSDFLGTMIGGSSGGDLNTPRTKSKMLTWLALTIVTASYGGLHFAAWNSFFPTSIEALIWRFSSFFRRRTLEYTLIKVAVNTY